MLKALFFSIAAIVFASLLSCSKDTDPIANINKLEDMSDSISVDEVSPHELITISMLNNYNTTIDTAVEQYGYNSTNDYMIIVNTTGQMMYLIKGNILVAEYVVSTGKTGEGSLSGSGKTPLGYHKIVEKIGDKAPIGTIFVGKKNTGKISPIYTDKTDVKNDPVVTRILSLDGLEVGYNKGGNVDSYKRFIYIHGTHEEGLLGTKTSHGCIRMKNTDVIELFDTVPNNTIVYITQ